MYGAAEEHFSYLRREWGEREGGRTRLVVRYLAIHAQPLSRQTGAHAVTNHEKSTSESNYAFNRELVAAQLEYTTNHENSSCRGKNIPR